MLRRWLSTASEPGAESCILAVMTAEIGGDGWESNPPRTNQQAPQTVLKTAGLPSRQVRSGPPEFGSAPSDFRIVRLCVSACTESAVVLAVIDLLLESRSGRRGSRDRAYTPARSMTSGGWGQGGSRDATHTYSPARPDCVSRGRVSARSGVRPRRGCKQEDQPWRTHARPQEYVLRLHGCDYDRAQYGTGRRAQE